MLEYVTSTVQHILAELRKVVVGQDEPIEQILVALLAEGHALIEGVPGTAKTLTVKTLSRIIGADFNRIQFTPDLMPSDITGTNIFNLATSEFTLRRGPVFTDILLADEINRTPPKTPRCSKRWKSVRSLLTAKAMRFRRSSPSWRRKTLSNTRALIPCRKRS